MDKSIIHRALALIYLGIMAACIVFVIKPGAAIFYYKLVIDNQSLKPDVGYAYRYHLDIYTPLFRFQDMLLFEDGQQLTHADASALIETGEGTFASSKPSETEEYLYFSSSDNSNPITNGRKYTIFLPYSFVTSPLGVIYLIVLLPGLAWFLYFALATPEHRKAIIQSPAAIFTVLDRFFEYTMQIIGVDTGPIGGQIKARRGFWKQLISTIILASFFYALMEWLFFVTKPSFMSIMGIFEKAEIFLLSGFFISISMMVVLAMFICLDLIMIAFRRSRLTQLLGPVIPAAILFTLTIILIDNFTYTVFNFGISTSMGTWREIYRLAFFILFWIIYLQMLKFFSLRRADTQKKRPLKPPVYFSLGIMAISAVVAVARLDLEKMTSLDTSGESRGAIRRPNIFLLGSDGLIANNMSVYGYERDTTPRLRELARDSLVAENAFPNSGNSIGSVVSIMTGKLPTTTRVGFSTYILTGVNAFQHLPGILKSEGYKTAEYGVPSHVDAYSINMQNSFDLVNDRSQREGTLGNIMRKLGYDNPAYFIDRLAERISERILHILYIREMQNPFILVTKPADRFSDLEKIDQALSFYDRNKEPLFVHVHLMGTHGDKFTTSEQVFSKGKQQDQSWMVDFYDDAILSFDRYIGKVIDHLKATGQFENTILIIYSDHDPKWMVINRIPLIFHFPGDDHTGRISENVQNLDIAPSILDYLGVPKPDWMRGDSLLNNNLNAHRLIFGTMTINPTINTPSTKALLGQELMNPSFHQVGYVNMIDCQRWYLLNLKDQNLSSGDITGYTAPCSVESLSSADKIRLEIIQQLTADGFKLSDLSKKLSATP